MISQVIIYQYWVTLKCPGYFIQPPKNVEMLVGGFGAEYGGRNSSVLYITTREGNDKKLHGEIKPTIINTNVVFDFPVGKNATMMISGRAYYDLISRFFFYFFIRL